MESELIHDRGRGPELIGTRITAYDLFPDLLDPTMTEAEIGEFYSLTPQQVAAMRGYILSNPDTVLAQHLKIEERIAAENPPQDREQAQKTRELFLKFRDWLVHHREELALEMAASSSPQTRMPTFREWLAEQQAVKGS